VKCEKQVRNSAVAAVSALAVYSVLFSSSVQSAGRAASSNYVQYCSGCHGLDGRGAGANSGIPDFRNFVGAFASDDCGRTYVLHVPGVVNTSLGNAEMAALINYLMRTWGGTSLSADFVEFTAAEVQTRRAYYVPDVVSLRRQIVERLQANGIATAPYPWP
jgi:mono/diheme cytochrome c family protein